MCVHFAVQVVSNSMVRLIKDYAKNAVDKKVIHL